MKYKTIIPKMCFRHLKENLGHGSHVLTVFYRTMTTVVFFFIKMYDSINSHYDNSDNHIFIKESLGNIRFICFECLFFCVAFGNFTVYLPLPHICCFFT